MESLAHAMLGNALVAAALALVPAVAVLTRAGRSPALIHSLWLLVLLKLVTPPLVRVPLELNQWIPRSTVLGAWSGSGVAARVPHPHLPPQRGRGS